MGIKGLESLILTNKNGGDNPKEKARRKSNRNKLAELIKSGKVKPKPKLKLDPNSDNFDERLDEILGGAGNARDRNKLLMQSCQTGEIDGGEQLIEDVGEMTNQSIKNIVAGIGIEPVKQKMLENVRDSLPLQSLVEGEESMAVDNFMVDKNTCREIFGTDNFDEVKDKIKVDTKSKPPVIYYEADTPEGSFTIATIGVREDGKNYGAN